MKVGMKIFILFCQLPRHSVNTAQVCKLSILSAEYCQYYGAKKSFIVQIFSLFLLLVLPVEILNVKGFIRFKLCQRDKHGNLLKGTPFKNVLLEFK